MIYDVVIVGAGISGLQAAASLRARGAEVLVLEKSRGLGGRAATRRWDNMPVDHGAQFFTARSPEFVGQVETWLGDGVCHEWTRGFHRFDGQRVLEATGESHPRYACREGMSALGKSLAAKNRIAVEREARVTGVEAIDGGWTLHGDQGRTWRTKGLMITAPPAQAASLLEGLADGLRPKLTGKNSHPCLAVAVRVPRRDTAWCGIQCDDAIIAWLGNDTSKRPELHAGWTVVMVHASAEFSATYYGAAEDVVVPEILQAASKISGLALSAGDYFLHRWKYAQPEGVAEPEGALVVEYPAPLVVAGDAWSGGRIEGAWRSGLLAAEVI